jgi:Protein of unknown function (DUF3631)
MTTAQETLTKHGISLESYEAGRHYTTCPRCSHMRSREHRNNKVLGITIGDDGSVCWGCNHCAWTGPAKGSGERRELQSHIYRDKDGMVRFRKVRNLPGREPRFWFQQPDGRGGWESGTKGVDTKILYRADEVAKAIAEGRLIAFAEGEKDCDNLWAVGIAATCNAHGASEPGRRPKWTKAHSEQLTGADIVVFNDNDASGYEHADTTCKLSLGIAKRVRRLDLKPHWPDIPKGGDISDWLALGHTRAELDALIAAAPDYQPSAQGPESAVGATAGDGANGGAIDDDAELGRLARLAPLDYERARKAAAERLGIKRLSLLDSLVKAKRSELGLGGGDGKQGHAIEFPEPEPWPDPVNGAELLDDLARVIRKHVVLAPHARDACALWILHTYLVNHFLVSPRLAIRAAVRGCGKTTLLDVLEHLTVRPLRTSSVTASVTFRLIEAHQPTLLIDEADKILNEDRRDLLGILNDGHRRGGRSVRNVPIGDGYEPRSFATFSALAIALIGSPPAELYDRSVVIDLKRRLPSETIEQLRIGRTRHLEVFPRRSARWVCDHADAVAAADPKMPDGIHNREADNWHPLLAIADVASADWPERARKAAQASHNVHTDGASRLELLLGDIRDVFDGEEMPSADLVAALVDIDGSPWKEMGKSRKPLTQTQLARLLKPFGIATQKIGPGKDRLQGYVRGHFSEAFGRYLGSDGASQPDNWTECDEIRTSENSQPDSPDSPSPVAKCEKSNNDGLPSSCPVAKGGNGKAHASRAAGPCAARGPEQGSDPPEPCAYCNRPGGNAVAFGDGGFIRLHRECEQPWIENRMAEEGIWRA